MAEDKIFKYKGKTLEELQAMSLEEFSLLVPSIIRRKMNRGFTEQEQIFLEKVKTAGPKTKVKTHCRDMIVLPEMIGKKVMVYSGKEFVEVELVVETITLRLGQLVPSKKIATHTTLNNK